MMNDRLQGSAGLKESFEKDRIRQLDDGIWNGFYGIEDYDRNSYLQDGQNKKPPKVFFWGFLPLDTINLLFSSNLFHAGADARKALFPEHAESGRL